MGGMILHSITYAMTIAASDTLEFENLWVKLGYLIPIATNTYSALHEIFRERKEKLIEEKKNEVKDITPKKKLLDN